MTSPVARDVEHWIAEHSIAEHWIALHSIAPVPAVDATAVPS